MIMYALADVREDRVPGPLGIGGQGVGRGACAPGPGLRVTVDGDDRLTDLEEHGPLPAELHVDHAPRAAGLDPRDRGVGVAGSRPGERGRARIERGKVELHLEVTDAHAVAQALDAATNAVTTATVVAMTTATTKATATPMGPYGRPQKSAMNCAPVAEV